MIELLCQFSKWEFVYTIYAHIIYHIADVNHVWTMGWRGLVGCRKQHIVNHIISLYFHTCIIVSVGLSRYTICNKHSILLHICRSNFRNWFKKFSSIEEWLCWMHMYILLHHRDVWHETLLCIKLQTLCTSIHVTKDNNFPIGLKISNISYSRLVKSKCRLYPNKHKN